ncbi:exonuclease domain-containing protein [Micromonospora haikouensis]|uniref:exonuclease domain-containing protein n=1 Tax=Micromonospora haikouensis TaxID=686309 RepID=UPI00341AC109
MTWHLGPMLAYDCETTGVEVEFDRIVTAATVMIEPGSAPQIRSTVINPGVEVPASAAEIHGWTTERVQAEGKPPAGELAWIANTIAAAFTDGVPVVVANAPFDLTLLDRECRRHNVPTVGDLLDGEPMGPVIDPMCIDKALDRYRPGKRKLDDLCLHYGARLDGAHDAEHDALAAARVAYRLGQQAHLAVSAPLAVADMYAGRRYPERIVRGFQEFAKLTLPELHAAQVRWYADQAGGLIQHWQRQANDLEHRAEQAGDDAERETALADAKELRERADGVTTEWPIRPFGGVR